MWNEPPCWFFEGVGTARDSRGFEGTLGYSGRGVPIRAPFEWFEEREKRKRTPSQMTENRNALVGV